MARGVAWRVLDGAGRRRLPWHPGRRDTNTPPAGVAQGSTGKPAAQDAEAHQLPLAVVKRPDAKQGFGLLRRWVVERRCAGAGRFRRVARDDEQLPETLAGWHVVAFAILMGKRFVKLMV